MTAMVLVPALIGLLLLASALAKAIDLGFAARQLAEYGLVPLRWSGWLVGAISVTEAWLAAALLLDAGRGFVPLLAVATIGVATAIALWRGLSRGLADCGCHGRLVALSPLRSAAIHTMGCAVLAACWWLAPPAPVRPWGLVAASAVAALAAVCACRSLHRGALIDVSLLRAGRRFPARALARFGTPPVDPARQDALVALLSPGCARCVAWARVLDRCATLDGELPVLGLLGGSAKEAEAFHSQNRLRMPLMPVGTAGLLVLGNVAPGRRGARRRRGRCLDGASARTDRRPGAGRQGPRNIRFKGAGQRRCASTGKRVELKRMTKSPSASPLHLPPPQALVHPPV